MGAQHQETRNCQPEEKNLVMSFNFNQHANLSIYDKKQRGLNSMAAWYERWNIKITEDRTLAISSYVEWTKHSILSGVKYLSVIFDKGMTWILYIDTIEAKNFRTFIRLYSLFKSERLSANIKQPLHKVLIRSVMTYA
jgi:hypothetical protein